MLPNQENVADILQSCLEKFQNQQGTISELLEQYPDYRDDLRPMLEAARWLWRQSQIFDPRPGFVSASQDRLVHRIREGEMTGDPLVQDGAQVDLLSWLASLFGQKRFASRLFLAIILVISLFVGTSGVALASQDAIPGESLYPVKLAVEDLSLAFTLPASGDARLHIDFAERRLVEMQALIIEERYGAIAPIAAAYESQISLAFADINQVAATDPSVARQLAGLLEDALSLHSETVISLSAGAPQEAQPELQRVILVSEQGQWSAHQILVPAPATPTPTPVPSPQQSGAVTPQSIFPTTGSTIPIPTSAPTQPAQSPPMPASTAQPPTPPPVPSVTPPSLVRTTPTSTTPTTPPSFSNTPQPKVTVGPPSEQKATAQAKKTAKPQKTKKPKTTKTPK